MATLLLLGLAATAAPAQQTPVQLRYSTAGGRSLRYRTDVDAWLRSPMIPSVDTVQPTVHITLHTRRTFSTPDSAGGLTFAEYTDSSKTDLPQLRVLNPSAVPPGDYLRAMRSMTRMDARGRGVSTRVIETPNLPQDISAISRGTQGLAITCIRMAILALPGAPVRPGDSWTDSLRYDQEGAVGLQNSLVTVGGSGLATFRLERIETRGGRRIAVITTLATVNAGASEPGSAAALTVTANGFMDFDIADGILIRSQMDLVGPMMTRGGQIPVHVHMVMQLL